MKKIELSENFTYGKLIVYALPSILNMLVSISFQMVDGYFVSNLLGVSAFAAVNLVMPLCVVLFALGLMFGTGSSAVAARYLGSGEEQKAREIFSCAVVFMIVVGLILGGILVLLMPAVGRMVGASVHSLDDWTTASFTGAGWRPFCSRSSSPTGFSPCGSRPERPGWAQ